MDKKTHNPLSLRKHASTPAKHATPDTPAIPESPPAPPGRTLTGELIVQLDTLATWVEAHGVGDPAAMAMAHEARALLAKVKP